MKTSIKMLLVFVGIVLLLVLASDVVLWAYYKKGINGDGTALRFPKKGEDLYQEKKSALHPFKAIVINANDVRITGSTGNDSIGIRKDNDDANVHCYKQVGDTLYLELLDGGITVYCKSVQYIKLAKDSMRLSLSDLKIPALEITAFNNNYLDLNEVEVGQFAYKGGKNSRLVSYNHGKIDSLDVQLAEFGSIRLEDIKVKKFTLNAYQMQDFWLSEETLSGLTLFKRN